MPKSNISGNFIHVLGSRVLCLFGFYYSAGSSLNLLKSSPSLKQMTLFPVSKNMFTQTFSSQQEGVSIYPTVAWCRLTVTVDPLAQLNNSLMLFNLVLFESGLDQSALTSY